MNDKAIAKNQNEVIPSYIKAGSNRGNEHVSTQDLLIPRIDVLQALSPQVNAKKEEYIEGAKVGQLFNTLTNEVFDSIGITPVTFARKYLVWVDRKKDADGGLLGVFDTEPEAQTFLESRSDKDKLEISTTGEHLVLTDTGEEVMISMAKSKLKVSRKFNSLIRLQGGDRFSRRYELTSMDDSSAQGDFMNLKITPAGFPSEEVYKKAEALYTSIEQGTAAKRSTDYSDITEEEQY